MGNKLLEMFNILYGHFGPQHWWPGDGTLEMIVGAVLTQNTSWTNVEKVIGNLKSRDLLTLEALNNIPENTLASLIRSAGYFNVKARRLKNLITYLYDRYEGDLSKIYDEDEHILREGLLSVKGVGPETADCILLYGALKPFFVVDAYTHRILSRHNLTGEESTYDDLQSLFMGSLQPDVKLFNEFHALMVITGKEYCRKTPVCDSCPLINWER